MLGLYGKTHLNYQDQINCYKMDDIRHLQMSLQWKGRLKSNSSSDAKNNYLDLTTLLNIGWFNEGQIRNELSLKFQTGEIFGQFTMLRPKRQNMWFGPFLDLKENSIAFRILEKSIKPRLSPQWQELADCI